MKKAAFDFLRSLSEKKTDNRQLTSTFHFNQTFNQSGQGTSSQDDSKTDGGNSAFVQGAQSSSNQAAPVTEKNVCTSTELFTIMQEERFRKNKSTTVIGYFVTSSNLTEDYFSTVQLFCETDNIMFAHTFNKQVLEKRNFNDQIVLYRLKGLNSGFEKRRSIYNESEFSSMCHFIQVSKYGLIAQRKKSNLQDFSFPLLVVYLTTLKQCSKYYDKLIGVAKTYRDRITFCISDIGEFPEEISGFGITSDTELAVILTDLNGVHYRLEEDLHSRTLVTFITKFLSGSLTPFYNARANLQNPVDAMNRDIDNIFKNLK